MPTSLTTNFTLEEMLASQTASRNGYDEQFTPSESVKKNLLLLCENVLQPLRNKLGKPIHVSSGYRCLRVNTAVRGANKSQHLKGQAADITVSGMSVQELFDYIINSGIIFDQIIQEFNAWVHISYSAIRNRRSILYAERLGNGRVRYREGKSGIIIIS